MPTQLTPEELIEIRELFTPPYRTNWQAGQKLFGHIEALTARAEKAEAALEVEKAKTALLWPVATKQTPADDAQ